MTVADLETVLRISFMLLGSIAFLQFILGRRR